MTDQTLDRREAILERLLELGQGLDGIAAAVRNHGPPPTGVFGLPRPSFLLFDGGAKPTQDVRLHKSPIAPTVIWCMTPQIVLVLENRDTVENVLLGGVEDPVGQEVSDWFMKIFHTTVNDNVLIDLVTTDGSYYPAGVETDLKVGRTVGAYGAWLMMPYEFYYPLFPLRP